MYAAMQTKQLWPLNGSYADLRFILYDTSGDYYSAWRCYLDQFDRAIHITWIPNELPEGVTFQLSANAEISKINPDTLTVGTPQMWDSSATYDESGYDGILYQYGEDEELPWSIIISGTLRFATPTVAHCPFIQMIDMPASYYLESFTEAPKAINTVLGGHPSRTGA